MEHERNRDASFATTQWTRVLAARGESDEARAALSELCEVYYAPVHSFVRHTVNEPSRTDDLVQEFFARVLKRDSLGHLERDRGKFRSYLLGAVKHFLADDLKHRGTKRAGGGSEHVPIATGAGDSGIDPPLGMPSTDAPADSLFDRQWAMTLLARAMSALHTAETKAGRQLEFEVLKPWLTGEIAGKSQADAARELSGSEGAVKVAVHRLRKRFRDTLRTEISHTVADVNDVGEELRYLVDVLSES